jgi:hypothetical protein
VVGPNTTTITTAIQPTLPSSHKSSSAQPLPSIESSIYFLSSWCKKVLTLLVSVFSFPPFLYGGVTPAVCAATHQLVLFQNRSVSSRHKTITTR